jgi:hypothetical protein
MSTSDATPDAQDSPGHPSSQAGAGPGPEPTEEELRLAWEEQLRNITVTDILVQTAVSLVNLAGRRLGLGPDGAEERDLAEVRDGIDAIRALVPVLERSDVGQTLKPLRDALAQLQLEYAKLVPRSATGAAAGAGAPPASPGGPGGPAGPAGQPPASRLWVPGR